MSNTVLQVKRSATTAIPASLANGELAYSGNGTSNSLFIGHPDGTTGVIRIAGGKYPYLHQTTAGTLTANAAVVTDSNAFISNVYSSGLFISASIATPAANSTAALITSITPQANSTQLGASAGGSNTELVTSYAIKTYVDGKASAGAVNTAGSYTFTNVENFASNVMIVGNTSSVLSIGNTATNTVSNSTTISFVNSTATVTINATSYGGTANNSTNFGGLSLATVQAQITGNAATAYTNATSYADTKAATAYSNATAYASNASNITTGTLPAAQLPANVVFWSNNNTFTGIQTFDNVVINGNTALGNATTDVITITARANTSIVPSANVTYDLGTTALYWRDVLAGNGKFDTVTTTGNLTVGGNINVTGNLITQNVSSVIISDPLIYLAGNNYTSDVVDIGFAANYSPDGVQELHTGLIRKNSTDNYYLFVGSTQELSGNNLVNTNATGFRSATLYSYLNSGALTSSNTSLAITANATISVSITANTLALNTALPATSGGTGWGSFTAGDILYASNTTYLSKLARGTDGQVLQMQGTTVAWASLDGGTF
jgi:trimeric autotransporter adhesin